MTAIQWTDETWNPTTGCDRVSPGCDHCYALTLAPRLKAMGQAKYQRDGDPRTSGPGFGLTVHPDVLEQPLRWRKPRRVFVNSMSDLFHPQVPDVFIAEVFAVMAVTPRHTYQILTKRPKRMASLLRKPGFGGTLLGAIDVLGGMDPEFAWPLPNVWLGVSVEDQKRVDQRVPLLLDTPAAIRFLSCEPLLDEVTLLAEHLWLECRRGCGCQAPEDADRTDCACDGPCTGGSEALDDEWTGRLPLIDWVIVGGESGPGARPMHPDWARDIRDQCQGAGVAFFMKQLGGTGSHRGDPDEWPEDLRIREYPDRAGVT